MKSSFIFGPFLILILTAQGRAQTEPNLARRSGCLDCHREDQDAIGPAFRNIAARYQSDVRNFDLTLMAASSAKDLPEKRRGAVIVAEVGNDVHLRIFDVAGRLVFDKGGTEIKGRLPEKWNRDVKALSPADRRKVLDSAAAGLTPPAARQRLIQVVKTGGRNNWPHVAKGAPMPGHGRVLTDAQIGSLVDWILEPNGEPQLRVLKSGLGNGTVALDPAGTIPAGASDPAFTRGQVVTLTAAPDAESAFVRWEGDAAGSDKSVKVTMDMSRAVRAVFDLAKPIKELTDLTPNGIKTYLEVNPHVNTPARFVNALRNNGPKGRFLESWILMTRSESLQTGTAASPRILLTNHDAQFVFTFALTTHGSFPGSHPNAVEYMQWDAGEKNFRFHEIVLDTIPEMDIFPTRPRGIAMDDVKCSKCHSTQNVVNLSPQKFPGTSGIVPGTVQVKNKPNWDAYDSWGGMLPFNRDRIYQGSVEETAFRHLLNLWNWRGNPTNDAARQVLEQLKLQPGHVATDSPHRIVRNFDSVTDDLHIRFGFDALPPLSKTDSGNISFSFGGPSIPATKVPQGGGT